MEDEQSAVIELLSQLRHLDCQFTIAPVLWPGAATDLANSRGLGGSGSGGGRLSHR
jgi:hypothetical protein